MYSFLRPLLFRLDAESAHRLTLRILLFLQYFPPALRLLKSVYAAPEKPVQVFGLTFKNPVGLAAGYDKDGMAIRGLAALGFGHLEIGTVTPQPQAGNPKPRVFRLIEDEAVINRMGFPSQGMDIVSRRLTHIGLDTAKNMPTRPAVRNDIILGINLGKNKDTPLEEAADDYIKLLRVFAPFADYLTVNISSPNTAGLRRLQGREMLENLLDRINLERGILRHGSGQAWNMKRPILVKISPDMNEDELDDAVGIILDKKMDGIIATNTTLSHEGLRSMYRGESGGLSGSPLAAGSEAVLRRVVKRVDGRIPIVSAGGIMGPDDAKKRLALGASLVQVYTGLIYRGPGLVKRIVENL